MEKVISVTIGKVVFNVEDDAYEKLSEYFYSIRKYFSKDKDREEIIEDIEASVAEKFSIIKKNRDLAITIDDIERVVEEMGTIRDFKKIDSDDSEEMGGEKDEKDEEVRRKLYRDPDDVIIAGVASGLAAYLGIETAIVRLLFFFTMFLGGTGVIIYFILWIILPAAETTAQKFEMRGEKVTLRQIEKSVKEGVERLKKKDLKKVEKGLNSFFRALGDIFQIFVKVVTVVIGFVLVVAGIGGICVLSFLLAWVIGGVAIPNSSVVLSDIVFMGGALYWLFVAALYVVAMIPVLLIFLLGISFLKRKSVVSPISLIVFVCLWFFAIGVVTLLVATNFEVIEKMVEKLYDGWALIVN